VNILVGPGQTVTIDSLESGAHGYLRKGSTTPQNAGMSRPRLLKTDTESNRRLYSMALDKLEDWPGSLDMASRRFVLLLACDARGIPDTSLIKVVEKVLKQGAVSVCAWGRDCRRVELVFDFEIVGLQLKKKEELPLIPTASHWREPLEEALYFFLECAKPVDEYARTCTSWLAVSVGNAANFRRIEKYLRKPMWYEEFGL
jgi:hypothetical protein